MRTVIKPPKAINFNYEILNLFCYSYFCKRLQNALVLYFDRHIDNQRKHTHRV